MFSIFVHFFYFNKFWQTKIDLKRRITNNDTKTHFLPYLFFLKHNIKNHSGNIKKKTSEIKMRFFKNFKLKLIISIMIGCFSSLYQMETKDELVVCEKKVMLAKQRLETFDFLSNLENYPKVQEYFILIFNQYFKIFIQSIGTMNLSWQ